jgi:hypothetical protein
LEDVAKEDPLSYVTYLTMALLLLTSIHIWIHSHNVLAKFFAKVSPTPKPEVNNKTNKVGYFQETKNIIIGAGGTLAAITMMFVFMVPLFVAKMYLGQNPDGINFGKGRAWTYIGRMTMPVLSFIILPGVTIVNNAKMRKVLMRKLKDKMFSLIYG